MYSSLVRSSFLFFTVMSLLQLDSRALPLQHNKGDLDTTDSKHMGSTPWEVTLAAGDDFAFGSKDGQGFPNVKPELFLDDDAQATRVWPRTMLDYMKQQLRFRGRTKKEDIQWFHA